MVTLARRAMANLQLIMKKLGSRERLIHAHLRISAISDRFVILGWRSLFGSDMTRSRIKCTCTVSIVRNAER